MNEPSYVALYKEGRLKERVERVHEKLRKCVMCPRACGVDRIAGELGFCKNGRKARIASYGAHLGEETPLVGRSGSGAIFFSSCNLLCSFCQNYDISHLRDGRDVEAEELAMIMINLQKQGCHNINFVTPSHVVPQILESLMIAAEGGLNVPLVYNTSAYDSIETLQLLKGIIDIYMPDFKFWDSKWADRFCAAPDYCKRAISGIREMHRQVGDLVINKEGIAVKGLLVRHLVMPNNVSGTKEIMQFLADTISVHTYVNIMSQYYPCFRAHDDTIINRRITNQEFQEAINMAKEAGLVRLD